MSAQRLDTSDSAETPKGAEPVHHDMTRRLAIVLACAAGAITLLPLLLLARYNAFVADDYCFASAVRVTGFLKVQWPLL